MHASEKAGRKLHHELKVIETLQREWNALSVAERSLVAKVSPHPSLFFRRGLAKVDRRPESPARLLIWRRSSEQGSTTRARNRSRAAAVWVARELGVL